MRWHWELERRLRAIKSVPSPRFAGALSAVGRVCGSYPAVDAAVQELSQNRSTAVSWLLCGFGFFLYLAGSFLHLLAVPLVAPLGWRGPGAPRHGGLRLPGPPTPAQGAGA